MKKIGFIGMGNMGFAILSGVLSKYQKEDIIFSEPNEDRAKKIAGDTGVTYDSTIAVAKQAKYICLSIKPQVYEKVLKEIVSYLREDTILISIAPGITIEKIAGFLGNNSIRIVRAMPNTPALIGEGMTGISYEEAVFSEEERVDIHEIFSSFGTYMKIEEKYMNAIVCMSGSSPAYAYMFIEALADAGVKLGLSKADSIKLAAQTLYGSAKMVLESGEHPAILRDRVCSPGGTTIEAVSKLEEMGFRNALIKASEACYEKCIKLS